MRGLFFPACATLALMAAPQTGLAAPTRSAPVAQPIASTIPVAQDIAWPGGTMQLEVDATDTERRILSVRQTIPVKDGGPLVLLFPDWLPGQHAPRGQIEKLAGLRFTVDGQPIAWRRDPLDMHAFHLALPAGSRTVVAHFQFLAPTVGNQGRVSMTDSLLNLQWNNVSLYPAGYYTRRIPIQARVTLPKGWTAATTLKSTREGDTVSYEATDYETLVDTPIYAGLHSRTIDVGNDAQLSLFADTPDELQPTPEQIAAHRKMVAEAVALFGARHYDRYTFLLSISDTLGGIGLEHHRLSENGVQPGYFKRWPEALGDRDLLAHEFVHSWNGKYRRPELLWTPDFKTPMQGDMLWLYEGQTQFWGYILSARSGMMSKDETLDMLATIAGRLDLVRGREWRPLTDTVLDPVISARRPKAWVSWQRNEDYYNEGLMIWLEADAIIQRETNRAKSLDDFAKLFFGMNDRDWGVLTYKRQDIVAALNAVVPYDWATFLQDRIDRTTSEVTKAGFTLGGYRLSYGVLPNKAIAAVEAADNLVDQSFGPGLIVANDGTVQSVIWESPAFKAGMTVGSKILSVNDMDFTPQRFRDAIAGTLTNKKPVSLIVKQDKRYRTIPLAYSGGLRYPRLEKIGEGPNSLDRLLTGRTGGTPLN